MIAVSEIFGPTIQGEGALIGVPTVFVRTGGCDFRCSWCDTRYAVDPAFKADWRPMDAETILAEVNRLSGGEPILVTLSGGNPALQPLDALIRLGRSQGHRFAMETQGSQAQPWFAELDALTLSPKPPSSGMAFRKDRFDACLAAGYPQLPLFLQPCNPTPATPEDPQRETDTRALNARLRWLVERIATDRWYRPRVLPQLHVLIWNNERGV